MERKSSATADGGCRRLAKNMGNALGAPLVQQALIQGKENERAETGKGD